MQEPGSYFDHQGRDDVLGGDAKLVPIGTPEALMAFRAPPVQVLDVQHASPPATPLRLVHRAVGGGDHFIGGAEAVRAHGDAHAGRHYPPTSPDLVRCSERLAEALGNGHGRLRRGHIVEKHDELVSTHASGGVACPKRGTKARRHIDEKSIAGGMTQGVVDHLEVIEIEEQDREAGLSPADELHAVSQVLPEQGAVRQSGQIVVKRSMAELLRGDRELCGAVSHPTLDLAEGSVELLAQEVHAGRHRIDDIAVGTERRAGLEMQRGELPDGVDDVFQASLETPTSRAGERRRRPLRGRHR
jgi:hypothetical protein